MYLGLLVLPLLGSLVTGLFGDRLGRYGGWLVIQSCVALSSFFSAYGIYEIGIRTNEVRLVCFEWFGVSLLDGSFGMRVDALSITMSFLVTFISSLVLLYSSEYMAYDNGYLRYCVYIGIFSFFMLVLVCANNMLMMFLGWEGVGIVSYLLISYWTTSLEGSKSSIQAVLVNRLGDISLLIGIIFIYLVLGSVNYDVILSCGDSNYLLFLGCLFCLIGCFSKSAQVGLHMWLPNAMAAPTPISALLHAATMVTAGCYLIIRLSLLLDQSSVLLNLLVFIGGLSIIVAGSIGLVVNDIKKIIAYSTGSQLGYMVLGCGLSAYKVSMYHLLNHGFFKALLFLSAGVVIHGMQDEQDLRRYGGLRRVMPLAYSGFVIGSIALMGLPFLAGYYSKDVILEIGMTSSKYNSLLIGLGYLVALIGAFLTALYSTRLLCIVFLSRSSSRREVLEGAEECGIGMSFPIIILSLGSIFVGYLSRDMLIGCGVAYWSVSIVSLNDLSVDSEYLDTFLKLLPVLVSVFGCLFGYLLYVEHFQVYKIKVSIIGRELYRFLSMKWFFDKLSNELLVQEVLVLTYAGTYKIIDKGLLELIGPRGLNKDILLPLGFFQAFIQGGFVYNYILVMLSFVLLFVLLI